MIKLQWRQGVVCVDISRCYQLAVSFLEIFDRLKTEISKKICWHWAKTSIPTRMGILSILRTSDQNAPMLHFFLYKQWLFYYTRNKHIHSKHFKWRMSCCGIEERGGRGRGSWIYNLYLCKQCLSLLTLWVRIFMW